MNRRDFIKAGGLALLAACGHVPRATPCRDTFTTHGGEDADLVSLGNAACGSLEMNLNTIGGSTYLAAGFHQFRSLWTRDFCWSVPALLRIGRADVVRSQLDLLLSKLGQGSKDLDAIARTYDNRDPNFRVGWGAPQRRSLDLGEPLRPQFLDQHDRVAIDGNALVVIACRRLVEHTGDETFWNDHRDQLFLAMRFYDDHRQPNGLVHQERYADWQDSLNRSGATFYTNLMYLTALEAVSKDGNFGVAAPQIEQLRDLMAHAFFDGKSGLFRSWTGDAEISLDSNLLAIELGFARDPAKLYASLQQHPLWTDKSGPGFVNTHQYSHANIAGQFWVSLLDYHTTLYWSWLMALSAKTAVRMCDRTRATELFAELLRMVRRDGVIGEVYEHTPEHELVDRRFYKSEAPFSWGAAAVIDAVDFAQRASCPA